MVLINELKVGVHNMRITLKEIINDCYKEEREDVVILNKILYKILKQLKTVKKEISSKGVK